MHKHNLNIDNSRKILQAHSNKELEKHQEEGTQ